jgi:hypothetical protein
MSPITVTEDGIDYRFADKNELFEVIKDRESRIDYILDWLNCKSEVLYMELLQDLLNE